ncbi:tRNA cytosine(34) acetyltransferase TmcA [Salmonella enterica]|nr:tRNA cytosine(34) acetyltransferase TmcA [Salmonella enterica subsp. diarizonae]EGE5261441.1 tRNA cytosine(34) acetyltransferase TmcA [Salmonella enterica subsp. diarizonae serovar 38:k:z]EKH2094961.1 tRNA cytosine(34) acetyltransferase TmcA [Salmonella enterica]EEJ4374702.1 tRNA cytosine(34) acetyltransferase TmcA [Salmonella enterica subsp. diarizonae]ELO0754458.1 tRNA cytosine(34) acetyltransferase TmcA [Salmonella enterica]
MSDIDALQALTSQMTQEGIRRLLVISGDTAWCRERAEAIRAALPGDWLWVAPDAPADPRCTPQALQTLLGREFRHAIFDAWQGFDAAAFAALSGTLQAGSWLLLLMPPYEAWECRPDTDSLRWSDCAQPIPTPQFAQHLKRTLSRDPQTLLWRQHQPFCWPSYPSRERWRAATGEPQPEQAAILSRLLEMPPGVATVIAARGRGKSALAGQFISQMTGTAIVTAPAKAATDILATFAGGRFCFMAPDALLESGARADWLVVDEAAAIPAPLLLQLVSRFPRTLLTTTVQGYEGTGRGFLLKFCARFPQLHRFALRQPVRWAPGCPLENIVSEALIFDDESFAQAPHGTIAISVFYPQAWGETPALPRAVYQLLSGAHYRTSPLDLRRMMDAPGQHFLQATANNRVAGALWLVEEGGLSAELSRAVWCGFRRPRGNLVAQSLAAHGSDPLAATLVGRRVSRIAVHPARQREGIGQQLIACACVQAAQCDYLSVSFGYTPELWRFWQRCGFVLVRMGNHREASSGCYTAMALLPLSDAGKRLAQQEHRRLRRDADILTQWNGEAIPLAALRDGALNDEDWRELVGFAFAHRPLLTSLGCLHRLLQYSALPLPALRGRLEEKASDAELCVRLHISGRKALLALQRAQAAQALIALDAERTQRLRYVMPGGGDHAG